MADELAPGTCSDRIITARAGVCYGLTFELPTDVEPREPVKRIHFCIVYPLIKIAECAPVDDYESSMYLGIFGPTGCLRAVM